MTISLIEAVEKSGGILGPYGERFGRLTVLHLDHTRRKKDGDTSFYDLCQCDCGKLKVIKRNSYEEGRSSSCGCLLRETATKHSLYFHPLYRLRLRMIIKCYNKSHPNYHMFGGNGIKVCDRWLNSTKDFIDDVESTIGPKPSSGRPVFSRINDKLDFEPGNICWTTMNDVALNRCEKLKPSREKQGIGIQYGKVYGRLRALSFSHKRSKKSGKLVYYDIFQCECGAIRTVRRDRVLGGITKSCGCYTRDLFIAFRKRQCERANTN